MESIEAFFGGLIIYVIWGLDEVAFLSLLITITFAVKKAFFFVMIPIGIAAAASRCYPQGKSRFVRYCNVLTYIGFFYMMILFWIIQLKK